ncbi:hypothetical protein C3B58_09090 [Lactonifactor longoviformis]|uniref:Uncharacterized protein n=1 Tax=Lactonifactor longoviformis DSM 17459 TaxID=1122155 RepID=A0A1M4XNR0_9CLOT|nr:hypothetical protein [Lactonifactor longoviformis]POP33075.1 hypothetical protein C3B58_09090 [Lactonifactor longoviformis]SHE95095.1 hypothetical protein SAMN02745158_02051 [Lactonifactor longoviformis DSM 17459]
MTKVRIKPGICNFVTTVIAERSDEEETEVTVKVKSGCPSVKKMMEVLGDTFDAYEVCLVKPGEGPFFEYAKTNFPVHAGCPILAGITKCIEAEQQLALKKDASIEFIEE